MELESEKEFLTLAECSELAFQTMSGKIKLLPSEAASEDCLFKLCQLEPKKLTSGRIKGLQVSEDPKQEAPASTK